MNWLISQGKRSMESILSLQSAIFNIRNNEEFQDICLTIFHYQVACNPLYSRFISYLGVQPEKVRQVETIPFLPIEFFKNSRICTSPSEEVIFTSSGTTGQTAGKHYVANLHLYRESFFKAFELFYGKIDEYCILALLPSYLERRGSSLVLMADELIKRSTHPDSGFYLNDYSRLANTIKKLEAGKQKTLLLGVTYALLDLAEQFPMPLQHTIIMETGGMKGKRRELIRRELHTVLGNAFHAKTIHSEYGMTELLSQAYSKANGVFHCPPWMKVLVRDMNDPKSFVGTGKTGGINVIDLANMYSCPFIATQDLGRLLDTERFEVLGRFDNSDVRGCNLMVV